MRETVTFLGPPLPSTGKSGVSDLPRDLLEQVRARVRLLSLLLAGAFAFDPVLYAINILAGTLIGEPLPPEFDAVKGFAIADAAVAVASAEPLVGGAAGPGTAVPTSMRPAAWRTGC